VSGGARIIVLGGERDAAVSRTVDVLGTQPDLDVLTDRPPTRERLAALSRVKPDVALLGRFPGRPDFTAQLLALVVDRTGHPVRVIALSPRPPDAEVRAVLRAGAVGFVRADAREDTVLDLVRRAAGGGAPRSRAATYTLMTAFAVPHGRSPASARLDQLTRRERDVLRLVARGLSNGEVAAELVVTTSTVKTHMNAILGKLALRDRVQATVFAYESGLIRPGQP
jgi:DNA-binding NarL/FixJ family response regulator